MPGLPRSPTSYAVAKRWLFEEVYGDRQETFYCRCPFDRDKRVDHAACGYLVKEQPRAGGASTGRARGAGVLDRAGTAVLAASDCASTARGKKPLKGRKCCARIDPAYRAAYNDLHNLWPSAGRGQRAAPKLWAGPGAGQAAGVRPLRLRGRRPRRRRRAAPRRSEGDVARIHLYLEEVHGIRLSDPRSGRSSKAGIATTRPMPGSASATGGSSACRAIAIRSSDATVSPA